MSAWRESRQQSAHHFRGGPALLRRCLAVVVLTVALALTGLAAPARAADPTPPTSFGRIGGLPTAAQPSPGDRAPVSAARVEELAATGAVVSAPVRAPMRFNTVGFAVPDDTEVAFRTSADGRTWTPWLWAPTLRSEDGPDPGSAEAAHATPGAASDAYWVGDAAWVQVRVLGEGRPEDVDVELVDSLGTSRGWLRRAADALASAWRGDVAAAAVATPGIVTRAGWGADEALRKGSPSYARRVRAGVVHHTVSGNGYTPADAPAVVRGIYGYHTRSLGWSDVGYNLLVDRYGTVYEGRHGGLERAVIGAHSGGFNTGTFGVSIIGDFSGEAPPKAALDALVRVLAWKADVHHLDVSGSVTLTSGGSTRYSKDTKVTLPVLMGHRDVSATACPGDALYRLLPGLRADVLAAASDMFIDPDVTPPAVTVVDGASVDGALTFTTRLRPPGAWTAEITSPDGVPVHTAVGQGSSASVTWTPLAARHGTYTLSFSGGERRPALIDVELRRPEIRNAHVSPARTTYGRDGRPAEPLRVAADLWNGARWTISLDGPGGRALSRSGTGARAEASWAGPVDEPGVYRWTLEANDAETVTIDVPVVRDVLERVGHSGDAVAGPIAVSQVAFPAAQSAQRAVLAREDVFADAMAGGPLAGISGPVLLTRRDRLDDRVRAELERVLHPRGTVYVLGGTEALGEAVEAAVAERWEVVRLYGSGRVETAAAVATEVVAASGATTALVARAGPDDRAPWADALSGGAYGASRGIPVLLTDTARLSPATRTALSDLGISATIVLGGTAAVSDAVVDALPNPRRVSGSDRTATAAAVARTLWGRTAGADGDEVVVTGGYDPGAWRLALAAAPLAALHDAPLLLTESARLSDGTRTYLEALAYGGGREASGWVLGSEADVAASVAGAVSALLQ